MRVALICVGLLGCVAGEAGADGADGADGTNGQDGIDNRIVAAHFCQGGLEGTVLAFDYRAALTAAGDVFASASVDGTGFDVMGMGFYSVGQVGAATAAVIFTGDFAAPANSGWWNISLNRSTGVTSLVYNDIDVSGGSDSWTMPASACISNTF